MGRGYIWPTEVIATIKEHLLPFQALIHSTSGKYLVEESEISYAPSLSVLFGQKSQAAAKISRNLVAFANSTRKDSAPLPEAEREVIVLRYYHAHSISELAQVLNVSERTVHNRLHNAHQRLRNQVHRP